MLGEASQWSFAILHVWYRTDKWYGRQHTKGNQKPGPENPQLFECQHHVLDHIMKYSLESILTVALTKPLTNFMNLLKKLFEIMIYWFSPLNMTTLLPSQTTQDGGMTSSFFASIPISQGRPLLTLSASTYKPKWVTVEFSYFHI